MVLIPHEHDMQCNVCLYINIIYVNCMPFLSTISMYIKYCTAMWVPDCMASTISNLVEFVLKLYHKASFQVTEVCTNHEFKPVLHVLQDSGWSFMTNLANTQQDVPEAKHNDHILKEHICATSPGIPYKMLPQSIIWYMLMETAAKLNYFPDKGAARITSAQGKFSTISSLTTRSTFSCLSLHSFT